MKDRIMSVVELDTLRRNLELLEGRLGYPAPVSLIDFDELSNNILGPVELDTTARNIRLIAGTRGSISSKFGRVVNSLCNGFYWVFGIVVLIMMLFY